MSNLIKPIQYLQFYYLKFHAINGNFQAILNFSNALFFDKDLYFTIVTNCHFQFYQLPGRIAL